MKGFKSVAQMKENLRKVTSVVTEDTAFTAKTVALIATQIDKLIKTVRQSGLSNYQLFMSYKLKTEKLPFNEALKQWRELNAS